MGIPDVMGISLPEYAAVCRQWDLAHREEGKAKLTPPTDEEFERAQMAVRH